MTILDCGLWIVDLAFSQKHYATGAHARKQTPTGSVP